jgi:ADP-heptose:LPS heptosyltransferase
MPRLERLISVEKRRYSLHWLEIWGQLATTRWDLVVDLRASAISWLLWTRRRAVIQGGRRPGHRLTHLAALLGVSPPPLPVIWTAPEDTARAAALLPEGRPWLVLGPTANWHRKVWPAERFAELALRLTAPDGALPGAGIAILGGPGDQERSMATPVLTALPQGLDLVGKLDLPEVAAVLARAAIFIGNDSGLMHLAAAAGAPTLGLFGPTPSDEYGPAGPKARAVLADGPPGQGVMEELPVARVLEAAKALIGQAAQVPA